MWIPYGMSMSSAAPARTERPPGPRLPTVLLLDGPEHMRQRKLLLPPLHGERMQRYGELMREVTEREIATWPSGGPFAVWPRMQAITLEVIIRAVFGVDDPERVERVAGRIRPLL